MNQNIMDTYRNLSIEEISNGITKTQEMINNLQDELSTLRVIKIKKEMGINYLTIREKQRQYQRQYYFKRKEYGKREKVYDTNKKPFKEPVLRAQILEGKIILEI